MMPVCHVRRYSRKKMGVTGGQATCAGQEAQSLEAVEGAARACKYPFGVGLESNVDEELADGSVALLASPSDSCVDNTGSAVGSACVEGDVSWPEHSEEDDVGLDSTNSHAEAATTNQRHVVHGFPTTELVTNNPNRLHVNMLLYNKLNTARAMPWDASVAAAVFNPATLLARLDPCSRLEASLVGCGDFLQEGYQQVVDAATDERILPGAAKRAKLCQSAQEPDELRDRAFALLHEMLMYEPSDTMVGLLMAKVFPDVRAMKLILEETFRRKAVGTLYKRTRAYWKYFCWASDSAQMARFSMAPAEESLYNYLCELRSLQRGPTSGDAFLQAVNFMRAMLSFTKFDASMMSQRVKGVAYDMYCKKLGGHGRYCWLPAILPGSQLQVWRCHVCDRVQSGEGWSSCGVKGSDFDSQNFDHEGAQDSVFAFVGDWTILCRR